MSGVAPLTSVSDTRAYNVPYHSRYPIVWQAVSYRARDNDYRLRFAIRSPAPSVHFLPHLALFLRPCRPVGW